MSQERVVIMDDFRPPVVSISGKSPVRSPLRGSLNGQKKVEDGRLLNDPNWNDRHHICPSLFNDQNHTYYKVRNSTYRSKDFYYELTFHEYWEIFNKVWNPSVYESLNVQYWIWFDTKVDNFTIFNSLFLSTYHLCSNTLTRLPE